jgi:hypothetical protein
VHKKRHFKSAAHKHKKSNAIRYKRKVLQQKNFFFPNFFFTSCFFFLSLRAKPASKWRQKYLPLGQKRITKRKVQTQASMLLSEHYEEITVKDTIPDG